MVVGPLETWVSVLR